MMHSQCLFIHSSSLLQLDNFFFILFAFRSLACWFAESIDANSCNECWFACIWTLPAWIALSLQYFLCCQVHTFFFNEHTLFPWFQSLTNNWHNELKTVHICIRNNLLTIWYNLCCKFMYIYINISIPVRMPLSILVSILWLMQFFFFSFYLMKSLNAKCIWCDAMRCDCLSINRHFHLDHK